MLRFHTPRVAASKTIPVNSQQAANDQQHPTLAKLLHSEQFIVQAAAALEAERLEPMMLNHYQVG